MERVGGGVNTQFQTAGRVRPEVENSIGYFASLIGIHVQCAGDGSLLRLMDHVVDELCQASERPEFSYMAAQVSRCEFARNTVFNWVPQQEGVNTSRMTDDIEASPVLFENPSMRDTDWDNDPVIVLYDTEDDIRGNVYYPARRFTSDSIEILARNLLAIVRCLIREPEKRISQMSIRF